MNQMLAESSKGRTQNSADNEKQRKRNLVRNIDGIADLLYKTFSCNGNAWSMTYDNTEKVAQMIMSEVLGYNTADLEEPVDDEICKRTDDILAQIRAKQKKDMFEEIEEMANEIMVTIPDSVDPFDDAMSIMEKK